MLKFSGKSIKKIYKTLLFVLLGVVILPGVLSLLLLLPNIQTAIVKKVTSRLSYDLGAEISIERISFSPFSGINISDLLIRDQEKDTLLFSENIRARIENFSLRKKNIAFGKIRLQSSFIQLHQHDDKMNYSFIIDSFGNSRDSVKWNYSLNALQIDGGRLVFEHEMLKDNGFVSDVLSFDDINLELSLDLENKDSLMFEISSLSVSESMGFEIKNMSAICEVREDKIAISQLTIEANNSYFDIEELEIPTKKTDDLNENVFRSKITRILIEPADIRIILKEFPDLKLPVSLSGLITGSLDNLKGNDINFSFGEVSRLVANFDINDLSNLNETFLYLDVKNMQTNMADLEFLLTGNNKGESIFPQSVHQMGIINYRGNFTGFIKDMVAYGVFRTNLGNINTDLGLKIRPDDEVIFGGVIDTDNFQLGQLLGAENIGSISLDLEISGSRKTTNEYFAFLDGNVSSFDFNDYQYNNISLYGLLANNKFDGSVRVDDPNGRLNFNGKVDMSSDIPHFNFFASIENAQLDRLKLAPKLTDAVLSIVAETDFDANNFDDLIGEIILHDGLLYTPTTSISMDSLSLTAMRTSSGKRIVLESDFAEGELTGQYNFMNFKQIVNNYLYNYLPSYNSKNQARNLFTKSNNFEFALRLKEVNALASVLIPDINISNRGFFKGDFNSFESKLNIEGELEHFHYKNIKAQEIEFNINSSDNQSLSVIANVLRTNLANVADIYNLSIFQKAQNDTLQSDMFWNNWNEITYSGALHSAMGFGTDENGDRRINLNIQPSSIIIADTIWNFHEAEANFYTNGFDVKNFKVEHENQFVAIDGFLHKEDEDKLLLTVNELNLNQFIKENENRKISIAGIINGELTMKDFFRDPLVSGDVEIDKLIFNGSKLGKLKLSSIWDKDINSLVMSAFITDRNRNQLAGAGLVDVKSRDLDFQFDADSLSIAFLDPFVRDLLQGISGTTSGKLYLGGVVTKPVLTGKVKLNDGSFFMDMLNASYTVTDSVTFFPNEIRFENMTVNDIYRRGGKFHGSIFHTSFKDLGYELRLDVNNMLVMNTNLNNNPYYYGTIFADGSMRITGTSSNASITINGQTKPNTRFIIPVINSETASVSNFINFASKQKEEQNVIEKKYTVNMSSTKIDMDIAVTPDADVKIIFDERMGDILQSTGYGNLQIGIDRLGNVGLYGDYTIEAGDYLFSLQNLVNKRFILNQGGTVRWHGAPLDAMLDISAIYKLRASLSELPLGEIEYSSGRAPIDCKLILTDRLQKPAIKFDIEAPTLDESRQSIIRGIVATEEEMNRQVMSLLVLNRFFAPEMQRNENPNVRNENTLALVTTTEMLSAQISRWISTLSDDFDIGIAYRPEDGITSEEFEVALSTQVLNNKVTINGNVGYGKYHTNTSKMVGDFDLDIKLNNSGTIRAKAYTHSNDDLIYESSPTTQGVGISFREEFNSFGELITKYKNLFTRRKKNKNLTEQTSSE